MTKLEELYQNIIDWSDNEELRRDIESRLLKHGYDKLLALPMGEKQKQRAKVLKWAEGTVILKYPSLLAWRMEIEWKNCYSLGKGRQPLNPPVLTLILLPIVDHDVNVLRGFIERFPEEGLALSLQAYLDSEISPFPPTAEEEEDEEKKVKKADEVSDDLRGPAELSARMMVRRKSSLVINGCNLSQSLGRGRKRS